MGTLSRKNRHLFLKMFSLFSVVRGYNILVIVLAQYLASIFILAPGKSLKDIFFDAHLFFLVAASAAVIAGGYIINNFYDSEKDLINRPNKTQLDRLVSQNTKLSFYFVLNFLAIIAASYVSFRAVLFFAAYIFGIWIYSHKIKRWTLIGNVVAATLAITPFFAIFLYHGNLAAVIFVHASFLFLVIMMRELVKDLENIKGDLAQDYKTIPIVFGEQSSKWVLTALVGLTIIPIYFLINHFEIGYMYLYFYVSVMMLLIFLLVLWKSQKKIHYLVLHNILKLVIVLGVFCILLLDVHLVFDKLKLLL